MAELDGFEEAAKEALLDDVEQSLAGERGNLAHQFVQHAHDILRQYGAEFDMNVEPIIDSFEVGEVQRGSNGVSVRLEWTHPAAGFFEVGASPHTIDGDPVLSFVWDADAAPEWVAEEFELEGDGYRVFLPSVDHPGMPESRFIRDTIHWLRGQV